MPFCTEISLTVTSVVVSACRWSFHPGSCSAIVPTSCMLPSLTPRATCRVSCCMISSCASFPLPCPPMTWQPFGHRASYRYLLRVPHAVLHDVWNLRVHHSYMLVARRPDTALRHGVAVCHILVAVLADLKLMLSLHLRRAGGMAVVTTPALSCE
ncbi:hypothetical protein DFH09DRAFT_1153123 [Mycena vulgaris]|nr:hypothetical protein DFH09DRAFT_1153123 [Mycena vulgaris]